MEIARVPYASDELPAEDPVGIVTPEDEVFGLVGMACGTLRTAAQYRVTGLPSS